MSAPRIASVVLALVLIGGALALMAFGETPSRPSAERDRVRTVRVADAEVATAPRVLHFSGVTRAARRAKLSFQVGGRVAARGVEIGDAVQKGDVLARIDERPFVLREAASRAALDELEARLAQFERDRARAERLLEERAATREEVEQVRAREAALRASRDASRAELDDARRLLSESFLRAPFDGRVREVHVEPGEHARPGQEIATLDAEGPVELEVELPESLIDLVRPGTPARVTLPLRGGVEVSASVLRVGRSAGSAGRLFPVVVTLDPRAGVPAGVTADLALEVHDEEALSLPLAAVVNPGGQRSSVFVLADSHARRIEVETGRVVDGRVTVTGPLRPGQAVVIAGHASLRDGERVEALR